MYEDANAERPDLPPSPPMSLGRKRLFGVAMMGLATFSQGCAGTHEAINQDLLARVIKVTEKCHQLKSQTCIEAELGAKFHLSSQYDYKDGRVAHRFRFEQESGTPAQDWWQWNFLEKDSVLIRGSLSISFNTTKQCVVESELVRRIGEPSFRLPVIGRGTPAWTSVLYRLAARNIDLIGSFSAPPCLKEVTLRFPSERIN